MPSSAEQLLQDALAQLRDEQAAEREARDLLRFQLQNEVARGVKMAFEIDRLNGVIRQLMRDRNGEP